MTHAQFSVALGLVFLLGVVFAGIQFFRAIRHSREEGERMASEAFERHRERGDM